jgi:hypothetical protein
MRSLQILLLSTLLVFTGCSTGMRSAEQVATTEQTVSAPKTEARSEQSGLRQVSLAEGVKTDSSFYESERKIIRTAALTMEVNSTSDAQSRVMSIAEARGGFVVTSESRQRENIDPAQRTLDIKLVVRLPASQFGSAIDEIKGLATNISEDNRVGEDVTEEFIDLEARIRTQKALEIQFIEIMKQAKKVEDALEVQRQIAEVRTEIEKIEGRRRFLENRSSLSTITINLRAPAPITVSTSGFGHSIRESASDSIQLAKEMLLFFIRLAIVLVPITAFIFLPLGLILRYLTRRAKRMRLAHTLATPVAEA